jgi:aspartyl-tRNA(Asn)/glutamyl-tRNA(Gln) amidotransferase subunit B
VVDEVLSEHSSVVNEYLSGKEKAFGFLVGQVMQKTRGKANPHLVNKMLHEKLNSIKSRG